MIKDKHIIELIKSRDGKPTDIILKNDITHEVYNIAWGYDIGNEWAHITTNISPEEGESIDFFYTSEILKIIAPENGKVLFKNES